MSNINMTILDWTQRSEIYKNACHPDSIAKEKLEKALGNNETVRFDSSLWLYEYIWNQYPELGPCPSLSFLAKSEHSQIFNDRYRDHSTHALKVFLLGLMFFEKNKTIKQAFIDNKINEKDFIITWIAISFWHDVGYLFENNEINVKNIGIY